MTAPIPPEPPSNTVVTEWASALRFDATHRGTPLRIDCDGPEGPAPLDTVLQALSACAGSDMVLILEKQRVALSSLRITATANRVGTTPRRFSTIRLHVEGRGEGLDEAKLERSAELAVTKYCSVRESLHPAIEVSWSVSVVP